MKNKFYILLIGFILVSCTKQERKNYYVDVYKENVPNTKNELVYCDTCITKLDVYKFEHARNTLPLHDKITLQRAKRYANAEDASTLIFIEMDSLKSYKIIQTYDVLNDSDNVIKYTARMYLENEELDNYFRDYSNKTRDYLELKSLYKNKKKMDDKYGYSIEYLPLFPEYSDYSILKEVRSNFSWQSKGKLIDNKFENYNMSIDYWPICNSIYFDEDEIKKCFSNLTKKDLYINFKSFNLLSEYKRDSIFDSLTLEAIKRRCTEIGFKEIINDIIFYGEEIDKRLQEEKIDDIYYFRKGKYQQALKLRNKEYYNKLMTEPIVLPEYYIEPRLKDENVKKN